MKGLTYDPEDDEDKEVDEKIGTRWVFADGATAEHIPQWTNTKGNMESLESWRGVLGQSLDGLRAALAKQSGGMPMVDHITLDTVIQATPGGEKFSGKSRQRSEPEPPAPCDARRRSIPISEPVAGTSSRRRQSEAASSGGSTTRSTGWRQ
jgi:hypothetical protein